MDERTPLLNSDASTMAIYGAYDRETGCTDSLTDEVVSERGSGNVDEQLDSTCGKADSPTERSGDVCGSGAVESATCSSCGVRQDGLRRPALSTKSLVAASRKKSEDLYFAYLTGKVRQVNVDRIISAVITAPESQTSDNVGADGTDGTSTNVNGKPLASRAMASLRVTVVLPVRRELQTWSVMERHTLALMLTLATLCMGAAAYYWLQLECPVAR